MALLSPRSRRSCPPTTTDRCRARGSITVLAALWCAVCAIGATLVVRTTRAVLTAAHAQASADAVALAHAGHGRAGADALAAHIGVVITRASITADGTITITVRGDAFEATASAR